LNQPNGGFLKLKKFQIKCGFEGFEIRNNFPYWNFSKFGVGFELENQRRF
jgi:hypothetical protein